ncbi:MAG: hypothetical protein HY746_03435, partial [Elusimicrobia bacterium]|nr:hypothetical protein [Elusimicrobiota bacterium]
MTKTISTAILLFSLSGSMVSFAQDIGAGLTDFKFHEKLAEPEIPFPTTAADEHDKTGNEPPHQPGWYGGEPKEWTIMAYINGNNDLEHRAIEKVRDMENAGSTDKVNMVAELGKMKGYTWDGQKWRGSRRYYLVNDGSE